MGNCNKISRGHEFGICRRWKESLIAPFWLMRDTFHSFAREVGRPRAVHTRSVFPSLPCLCCLRLTSEIDS